MGNAPAASVDSRSHMMAAVFPSIATGLPGYLYLDDFLSFVFVSFVGIPIFCKTDWLII
jgi:hypothetical protein